MAAIMEASIIHPNQTGSPPVKIAFPITDYEDVYRKLNAIGAGDAVARDCHIAGMDSKYPILSVLVGSAVNVDELDYLAKRLDSFWGPESLQFEGAAAATGVTGIEDFINLTFCCGKVTVIDNFSDLGAIGKDHRMNIHGGSITAGELESVDFEREALDFIQNETGRITAYGVVYLNGMELERLYQGKEFPQYIYDQSVLEVEAKRTSEQKAASTWLYLPMPQICADRALERGGLSDPSDRRIDVGALSVSSDLFRWIDWNAESLGSLNAMTETIGKLKPAELTALCVAADNAEPGIAEDLCALAYKMFPDSNLGNYTESEFQKRMGIAPPEMRPELPNQADKPSVLAQIHRAKEEAKNNPAPRKDTPAKDRGPEL